MEVLGRSVLIKPDVLPERTSAGVLVIPENSVEMLPTWGTVVQSGPACKEVRGGMRACFPRKSSSIIVIDDSDYYFTQEHKILYYYE